MPVTYDSIGTTTIATSGVTSQINFTSIPATYTDLRLVFVQSNSVGANLFFTVNADSSSAYAITSIIGNRTSATATSASSQTNLLLNRTTSASSAIPSMYTVDCISYKNTVALKTFLMTESLDLATSGGTVSRSMGLYYTTGAITQLRLSISGATFNAGTTATLYGIQAA